MTPKSAPLIDIAMGFDSGYAPHAAAVIASVIRRAPGGRFRFLILHADIDRALQARIESVASGHVFQWIEVSDDDLPAFAGNIGHLNRSTLFRLGLEKLAPADCHRVVYLDADLAVLGDVRELCSQDLGPHPVGAVVDGWLDEAEFAKRWNLPLGGRYLNAGVMLIDLDRVRAEGLFSQTIDILAAEGRDLPYNDQDALNRVFWMRWQELDMRWNVQRWTVMNPDILPADKTLGDSPPAIIHYTTGEKPWLASSWHPWSWLYWEALSWTPFLEEVARANGVSFMQRMRMRLRWLRHKPHRRQKAA